MSLATDKHRLRIYDTATSRSVGEYFSEGARVEALAWISLDLVAEHMADDADGPSSSRKKRRRKSAVETDNMAVDAPAPTSTFAAVALGMSNGSVIVYSPSHGRTMRVLSQAESTASVTAISPSSSSTSHIWVASSDGTLRLWDAAKSMLLASWRSGDPSPYCALASRPSSQDTSVLAAHHTLNLFSGLSYDPLMPGTEGVLTKAATFIGHATPVAQLAWHSHSHPVSRAEGDRFISIWDLPTSSSEGRLAASIPLDSDARRFRVSDLAERGDILALSSSGKITVYALHDGLAAESGKKSKVATPSPQSTIQFSTKAKAADFDVLDISFDASSPGRIRIARLVGGVRPLFTTVSYLDDSKAYLQTVSVDHEETGLLDGNSAAADIAKRYVEPSTLAVRSGQLEVGLDASADDLPIRDLDGALDVDLADLSLGQRLTAMQGDSAAMLNGVSSSEASDAGDEALPHGPAIPRRKGRTKRSKGLDGANASNDIAVPATSLTRTLIQALHSSDSRLLETCLAHSDPNIVNNTVRRLPPQHAVPLLNACMERLGRGARAANMKGGGGGASAQRGMGLIVWIKAVLVVHSAHLMTMPDLVARLAGLHATLTARLVLQESLLSLSGRLDMVLSQIEMRASATPALLGSRSVKAATSAPSKGEVERYVEGESEDDDEKVVEDDADVEFDSGSEEGSVEDIELGASDSELDEGTEEEDESEDDSEALNGLIDDEAEEFDEESDEYSD